VSNANLDATSRLSGLDGLRGLCALGVIIFHHKHFAFLSPNRFNEAALPLKTLFDPLYHHGLVLVEVFFILSGFIFHRLYAARLQPHSASPIAARHFWAARFARLYPLYFLTLMVAAILLITSSHLVGQRFVYAEDGLPAFIQSLFMVQQWQPHAVHSFNGPNWSLSVEIGLYALFFLSGRLGLNSPLAQLGLCLWAMAIQSALGAAWFDLARGPPAFFLGGFLASLSLRPAFMTALIQYQKPLIACLLLGILLGITALYAPQLTRQSIMASLATRTGFLYGLIPLMIWLSLIPNGAIHRSLSHFQKLGDISYSLYLWHFPIQCLLYISIRQVWTESYFEKLMSPLFLGLVIGLNLIWAQMSLERIEKPMQKWILKKLTPSP